MTCPFLEDWRVNVDFLSEKMSYSIDPLPCDPIIGRYTDGGKKKQFQFAFSSKESYDEDARVNIENSGFYQAFEDWLEKKNDAMDLPGLSEGRASIGVEVLNKGYLYDAEGELAQYRIECRLLYEQEA